MDVRFDILFPSWYGGRNTWLWRCVGWRIAWDGMGRGKDQELGGK